MDRKYIGKMITDKKAINGSQKKNKQATRIPLKPALNSGVKGKQLLMNVIT